MPATFEVYEKLQGFVGLDASDIANLKSLQPIAQKHGPAITDAFYERIGKEPTISKHVEGRVDALKKTHHQWLLTLVGGDYGKEYFEARLKIGLAHVRIGLDPSFVEGVMSFIRTEMVKAIASDIADTKESAAKAASFVKMCDLDLIVINLSYGEDRLDRLSEFTGMKRALIENIIKIPKK